MKQIIADRELTNKNIKEKNNFKIFNSMTLEEWVEVVDDGLIQFLSEIIK
ncbi:hypothetical protein SAMN06265348_108290 [Pedobacter westerhofensis]|uniref:Uncharacterized protein n=1 Tax=Pedobacter westerhofensis TaxID=425512 RepID=A0A521EMG8_9SPHI|nr:hypothetical protein [Pedobacter westerhofensis]SMO85113.1 hypothetical protein SAMN06265348_108290 [Pedobacter westerhofensis]